ncbi:ERCC4 domain-containing protein [Xylogone sp. PMI_703]|nr:ERCC4 domain-containing protein [Xylogone sp. PMI_703]
MPVDVINLLSSSPDVTDKFSTLPPSRVPYANNKHNNVETKSAKDDWFVLSSDDDVSKNTYPELSTTIPVNTASTKSTSIASIGSRNGVTNTAHAKPTTTKDTIDGYPSILSDDFPSPSKLDELLLPNPKRRRLDSSPEPLPLRSTATNGANGDKARGFKRSVSNMETVSKPIAARRVVSAGLKRSSTIATHLDSDPIVFTSSPDASTAINRKTTNRKNREIGGIEIEDRFDRNGASISSRKAKVSDRDFGIDDSDSDLPDIGGLASYKPKYTYSYSNSYEDSQDISTKSKSTKTSEDKKVERKKKSEEKALEKEAEKERKRLAKEEKIREKERAAEIAKVNTLRTDKKVSAPEMIVDIPSCLESKFVEQVKTFLRPLSIEYSDWQSDIPIFKWRRKVEAEFNNEAERWEPVRPYIKKERHVMCVMPAKDFVDLALGAEGKDIDSHALRLKAKFDGCTVIYLIDGLASWMRKNKNVRNREFTDAVRSQMVAEDSAGQRGRKKQQPEYVDEDIVEDALLRLQVIHGALIHHTASMIEMSEWVVAFTQHISTIPYRNQKESLDTGFCMETGQVKTGDSPSDTYVKMLQEIIRITAPVAYGITAEYPTVQTLVKGLEKHGPLALEDIRKSANKDGGVTDRRIGPALSKRVWKVFLGRDEMSLDV